MQSQLPAKDRMLLSPSEQITQIEVQPHVTPDEPQSTHGSPKTYTEAEATRQNHDDARQLDLTGAVQPLLNSRSCVTCRRRKVRCDNLMPCTRCERGKIVCTYPSPNRAPRRRRAPHDASKAQQQQHATQLQNEAESLRDRVKKLEDTIQSMSHGTNHTLTLANTEAGLTAGDISGGQSNLAPTQASSNLHIRALQNNISPSHCNENDNGNSQQTLAAEVGKLVLNTQDGRSRYVNNGFLKDLNDQVSNCSFQISSPRIGEALILTEVHTSCVEEPRIREKQRLFPWRESVKMKIGIVLMMATTYSVTQRVLPQYRGRSISTQLRASFSEILSPISQAAAATVTRPKILNWCQHMLLIYG